MWSELAKTTIPGTWKVWEKRSEGWACIAVLADNDDAHRLKNSFPDDTETFVSRHFTVSMEAKGL